MFCTNCGKQIPDGSKFCTNCGATLGNTQPPIQNRQQFQQPYQQPYQQPHAPNPPIQAQKSKGGVIAVVVILVVALIGAGIFLGPKIIDFFKPSQTPGRSASIGSLNRMYL